MEGELLPKHAPAVVDGTCMVDACSQPSHRAQIPLLSSVCTWQSTWQSVRRGPRVGGGSPPIFRPPHVLAGSMGSRLALTKVEPQSGRLGTPTLVAGAFGHKNSPGTIVSFVLSMSG